MVVDDSVTVRKVTQRLLVREGYTVLLAKDGVDADMVVMGTGAMPDVMLARKSGLEIGETFTPLRPKYSLMMSVMMNTTGQSTMPQLKPTA